MLTHDTRRNVTTQTPDPSHRQPGTQRDLPAGPGWRLFGGLGRGVVGGLIATALMTLYRFPVFRALPPTADFWAKYVGGGAPEAYSETGLLLHFLYGGTAGGLFGVGISLLDFQSKRDRSLGAVGVSLVYGLALSIFGTRFIFRYLLDEELEPTEAVVFHVGHVIYGLTLGTWMGSRERSGEVYE